MIECAVAAEELRPVARPGELSPGEIREGHAIPELGAPRIACEHRPRLRVDLGHDEGCGGVPGGGEHPLHVGGDRETSRARGSILDGESRDLDRVARRHVLQKLERDSVRRVLEAAVALAVSGDVLPGLLPNRQGRRPPERSPVFVADVEHLARPVADGVVRPGRELILATVARPRVAAALGRHLEAERGIGDHVDPGRRRPLPLAEDRHVLPPVVGEATEAVEELERRSRQRRASERPRPPAKRRERGARRASDSSGRSSCSARLPRRLSSTARAAVRSTARVSTETRSARRTKTRSACAFSLGVRRRLARPHQCLQRGPGDPARRRHAFRSRSRDRRRVASSASTRGRAGAGGRSPDPRRRRSEPGRWAGRPRFRAPRVSTVPAGFG